MKKLKIIFNLITLALTTGLLVMITLAWYAVNKQASVEAGTGSVADLDNIVDTVEYYNFESRYTLVDNDVTNTIYRVKEYVYTKFGDNADRYQWNFGYDSNKNITSHTQPPGVQFNMNEYDYLYRDTTKYLIKIKLVSGKGLSNLQFVSTASYFMGFSSTNTTGTITNPSGLSMSSAIKFGCYSSLNKPTIQSAGGYDNAEVVINSEPEYSHFEYGADANDYFGAITVSKKTIASNLTVDANEQLEIYLLIDYNEDAINALYSYNLTTAGEWETGPQFSVPDFRIFILG